MSIRRQPSRLLGGDFSDGQILPLCLGGHALLHHSKGIFWGVRSQIQLPRSAEMLPELWACWEEREKLFSALLSPVSLYPSMAFLNICSRVLLPVLQASNWGDYYHGTHSHVIYLIQSLGALRTDFPQHFHCCWHLDQHPNIFIWHFPSHDIWSIAPKMARAGNALSSIYV